MHDPSSNPVAPDGPRSLRDAIRRNPSDFIAWVMLSDAELDHGNAHAGMAAAEHALKLRPGHPEALARLGRAHWVLNEHAEAVAALRAASLQAPQHPGIALWLGHALEDAGDVEAAAQAHELAHRLLPQEPAFAAHLLNLRRKLCDWRDLDSLSTSVRRAVAANHAAIEPFAFLSEDSSAAEQLSCARLRADDMARQIVSMPPRQCTCNDANTLRLGFLSNGFGAHPTGLLTVAFLESMSTIAGVEAHLFASNRDDASVIRKRLGDAVHTLHDVSALNHEDIAKRIRATKIDVLYDLRGWGGGGMPEVLARRPAPVQVNWLAYPGTSGAAWIDYVLADRYVLPPTLAPQFSEHVAWLPRCFQPSDTRRTLLAAPARPQCGLPETGVVFACFNNSYKLNPASFHRMLAILTNVPGSVLWLLAGPGRADDRLRAAAQTAGIDASRLVFVKKQAHAAYMALYQHADLFLDTNPYNAHTTASDALWAGCPVLTRPGETFASRVAASLNHHLGLHELNVDSDEDFIATAIALCRNAQALANMHTRLHQARAHSGLFDMDGFALDFVAAARHMAYRQREGLPPASFG